MTKVTIMRKRTLIYIAHTIPDSGGLCKTELQYMLPEFDKVIIISNDNSSYTQIRNLPPHAHLYYLPYELSPKEKIKSLISLFSKCFIRELFWLRKKFRIALSPDHLKILLFSLYQAKKTARYIHTLLAENDCGKDEIFCYSFWANDMALGLAVYKMQNPAACCFTRAHRADLYFYTQPSGFLPFRRFMNKHLDGLYFISDEGKTYFEQTVGGGAEHHFTYRLGSEKSVDYMAEMSSPPIHVVSCSMVHEVKRIDLIIDAMAEISSSIRWTHIGDGADMQKITDYAANKLRGKMDFHFTGYVEQDCVLATLASLKPQLFINVSSSEGLPVTFMEAMSLGIPVIGTGVGGSAEIISDGNNGFLLPANPSATEVAEMIIRFCNLSASQKIQMSGQAYKTWSDSYNADNNFPSFVRHIKSLGEQKRKGRG
jgi:glycosyltransferase involved in cell wall biosynthesis